MTEKERQALMQTIRALLKVSDVKVNLHREQVPDPKQPSSDAFTSYIMSKELTITIKGTYP